MTTTDPFGPEPSNPMGWGRWRNSPDCARCLDTGRFRDVNAAGAVTEGPCGCKRGQRMSELWYAQKHGFGHPDEPDPEPDFDPDGAPF